MQTIRERGNPVVLSVNLYPSLYAAIARTLLGRGRFRLLMSVNTTEFQARKDARRMPLYRRVLRSDRRKSPYMPFAAYLRYKWIK